MREFSFSLFFIVRAGRKKVLSTSESEKCDIWKEVRFKNRHETLKKGKCLFCNLETEIPKKISARARPEKKKNFKKSSEINRINC